LSLILVIEDSPSIALLLRRRLEMAHHEVQVSTTGRQALEMLEHLLPDVVLADVTMPGMDGIETLRRIKEVNPRLPVILVTGQRLGLETRREADAHFSKPIDFDRLLEKIDELAGPAPEALAAGDLDPDA
jgi:CheY-like chemotaxis protein